MPESPPRMWSKKWKLKAYTAFINYIVSQPIQKIKMKTGFILSLCNDSESAESVQWLVGTTATRRVVPNLIMIRVLEEKKAEPLFPLLSALKATVARNLSVTTKLIFERASPCQLEQNLLCYNQWKRQKHLFAKMLLPYRENCLAGVTRQV